MFNTLSFKIGILFFIFILVIESFLFFILYQNLADDRIDEVMNSLLARGNTHRDVLEGHFEEPTLEHVGIMESESEFSVVITDNNSSEIIASDPIDDAMREIIRASRATNVPAEGSIIEDRWKETRYIATDSPIVVDGKQKGHVYMFAHSDIVKRLVAQLGNQFLIASLITVFFTVVTIFILSRLITHPLIQMKEATEQLSHGNHQVSLHTDRKDELGELANSITKLSHDLEQMKQARNEFLSSIAHELRTPLSYIKGYADIIHRGDITEDEMRKYVHIIREETEKLTNLIGDLFALAKLDQNRFVIQREKIELCGFLHQMKERMRLMLEKKNLILHVQCVGGIFVRLDSKRFQQVLLNILHNAMKYSTDGGEIMMEAYRHEDTVIIATTDKGEGIAEEHVPYIFDRLYRVDQSRSRQYGGSGLGLAIAKEITESHGGDIFLESQLGEGTRVVITLPGCEGNA